ncbi:hypothetical protein TrST_g4874 [Triparma strigata]|uniref:Ubiquitin-like protease family profile domain-containing protein n=1 Tax=Triparma strigata TaxID=1606541 RepID=A0A9W7AL57_9STRA|nr:hypothetical protein TrST_g4874 [Triparma strigata]
MASEIFSVYVPTAFAPVTLFTDSPTNSPQPPTPSTTTTPRNLFPPQPPMVPKPGLGLRLRSTPYPSHEGIYVDLQGWSVPLCAWLTFYRLQQENPMDDDTKKDTTTKKDTNKDDSEVTSKVAIEPPQNLNEVYVYQNSHVADFFNTLTHHLHNLPPSPPQITHIRLTSISSTSKCQKFPFKTIYLTGSNCKKKLATYMKSSEFSYPVILTFELLGTELIKRLIGEDGKRRRKVMDKFQRVNNVDAFNEYVENVNNTQFEDNNEDGDGKATTQKADNEVIDLSIDEGVDMDLTSSSPSSLNPSSSSSILPPLSPDPPDRIFNKTLVSFPASPTPHPPCGTIFGVKIGSYSRRYLPEIAEICVTGNKQKYEPEKIALTTTTIHRTYCLDLGWGVAYVPDVSSLLNLDVNNSSSPPVCSLSHSVTRKGKKRKTQVNVKEADRCRVNLKGCHLNDTVVNFYGRWIGGTGSNESIYVFPTYFYTKISNVKGSHQSLTSCWDDIGFWIPPNLWTLKFIIFPINYACHWSTAVICNPGGVFGKDVAGVPAIIHLDSGKKLKAHSSGEIYKVIRLFLTSACIAQQKESEREKDYNSNGGDGEEGEVGSKRVSVGVNTNSIRKNFNAEKLPGFSPINSEKGMPQQDNEDDCGVYLLKTIKAVKDLADGGFVLEKKHVEEKVFRVGQWTQKDVDDFREELGRIFYDVGRQGRETKDTV